MANENVTTQNTETTVTENQQTNTTTEQASPSIDELMAQIAEEKARADKNKLELDKALKENSTVKKQLRATLTADEQKKAEEEEKQRLRDEELDTAKKELNHIKAVNAYKAIPEEKVVENLIDAVSDADHNAIAQIIENEKKRAVAEAEQKWMKERPRVNSGQYSSMTKEQIMAIPDRSEKLKAIAMNKDLFN